jgi:muramoyltetrapeptide carboxypeptidase
VAELEAWGLTVRLGDHINDRHGYMAGRDEDRAADLMTMWADPDVLAIVCLGAGYGSGRLIRHLDRYAIAATPKALCGYSDITALHLALQAWSDAVTFYSIGAGDLASPETSDWSKASLHRALFSSEPFGDVGLAGGVEPRTIVGGVAIGRLSGGCLPVLTATIGTTIQPSMTGRILVLEDVHDRALQEFDRGLVHLRDSGLLDGVTGVVVSDLAGRPVGPFLDASLDDVLGEVLAPVGVPVLAGLAIGHGQHHGTIPLGAMAKLDADAGRLVVDEVVTADR